jgi:hypothetical protein
MENESILKRLETYVPPPYPVSALLDRECFDYRVKYGSSVPANIIDTFIFDILRIAKDYGIPKKNAWLVLRLIRAVKGYEHLPGYKPWTFWNFVNSLDYTSHDTFALEREIQVLIESGRDWKTEQHDLDELPEKYRD